MELFDKNGCLTDEGLQALQAGGLDELGRLETAEHLAYCDKCMDRYTALLTADALETPPHSAHKAVMAAVWVRLMQNTWGRAAVAGVAAVLAFTMWRSGTVEQLLDFRQELRSWTQEASQSQTEEPAQLGRPVEDGRRPAEPKTLGRPVEDEEPKPQASFSKAVNDLLFGAHSPAAEDKRICRLPIKRNEGIDHDEKRDFDLYLCLLPGRRPDVSGLYEARPFADHDVLPVRCNWRIYAASADHRLRHRVDVQLF